MAFHPKWSRYTLVQQDDDDDDRIPLRKPEKRMRSVWISLFCLTLAVGMTALATSTFFVLRSSRDSSCRGPFTEMVYSPATNVGSYQKILWTQSEGDETTKYQEPPSDSVDARWARLYDLNAQLIPTSKAQDLMDNYTSPVPGREDQSIVMLAVFHQLHCLDSLRMALHPKDYPPTPDAKHLTHEHFMHCIDMIRQSLMCFSDITPIPFEWDNRVGHVQHHETISHTCRDYEAIRSWAVENSLEEGRSWADFPRPQRVAT